MKKYSVCYPIKFSLKPDRFEILLGKHKDTPGARKLRMVEKWNGFGGKFEDDVDKDMFDCCIRECRQESGLIPYRELLYRAGIVLFNNSGSVAEVHFFFTSDWQGSPVRESEEMSELKWYPFDNLPYLEMMDADRKFQLPLKLFEAMQRNSFLTNTIFHDEEMRVLGNPTFTQHPHPELARPQQR